jgi:hypothetical protein
MKKLEVYFNLDLQPGRSHDFASETLALLCMCCFILGDCVDDGCEAYAG